MVIDTLYEKNNEWSNVPLFPSMKATSSFIVYDEFDLDNVIRLKYRTDKSFEVELITRDVDDEEIKHSHILEGDELKIIPEGLASLMKEVLDTKETRAVKGKNLG